MPQFHYWIYRPTQESVKENYVMLLKFHNTKVLVEKEFTWRQNQLGGKPKTACYASLNKQGHIFTCSSRRDPHMHATAQVDRAAASSSAKRAVCAW